VSASVLSFDLQQVIRLIPGYDPFSQAGECWFDEESASFAIEFVEECCTHVKGPLGGQRLILEPWEKAIFANLWGWKRPDQSRRYRESLVYIPRGNAKTTLAAALINLSLFTDMEPGAELYSSAAEREQARLCFDAVAGMIRQEPELEKRAQLFKYSITVEDRVYKALSAEAGSKHGFNVHLLVNDELHAQKTPELTEVLLTGMGKRKQPLAVHLTTADYERENSICNQKHDYAKRVAANSLDSGVGTNDPAFLPVVYEADETPHTIAFYAPHFFRGIESVCNCNIAHNTQTVLASPEACARLATLAGGRLRINHPSDAQNIQSGRRGAEGCAVRVTSNGYWIETLNTSGELSQSGISGRKETPNGEGRLVTSGGKTPKTDNALQSTDATLCMGSRTRNSGRCTNASAGDAPFAENQLSYASIIAMLQALSEDCSVPDAIRDSDYSEILPIVCDAHSPTCCVQTAKLRNGYVLVESPADDWTDPKVWAKANPNLGVSVPLEYIERECAKAKDSAAYLNTFLRLHLNVRTQSDIRWLTIEKWDACPVDADRGALAGNPCFGGLDLSTTTDLSALVLAFPRYGGGYSLLCRFWVPEENAHAREKKDRVPYSQWIREGWITATPGNVIDYDVIRADIVAISKQYQIKEIACDRWNATQLITQLTGDGIQIVAYGQGFKDMTAPTKELEALVVSGKLDHCGNPVLRWMASNVTVEQDAAGNLKPSKAKSTERIDGIVAAIMAIGRAMVTPCEKRSYYEDHDVEFM